MYGRYDHLINIISEKDFNNRLKLAKGRQGIVDAWLMDYDAFWLPIYKLTQDRLQMRFGHSRTRIKLLYFAQQVPAVDPPCLQPSQAKRSQQEHREEELYLELQPKKQMVCVQIPRASYD